MLLSVWLPLLSHVFYTEPLDIPNDFPGHRWFRYSERQLYLQSNRKLMLEPKSLIMTRLRETSLKRTGISTFCILWLCILPRHNDERFSCMMLCSYTVCNSQSFFIFHFFLGCIDLKKVFLDNLKKNTRVI